MKKVNTKSALNFLLILVLIRPSLDILNRYEIIPFFNFSTLIGGLVFLIAAFLLLRNIKKTYTIPLFYPILIFLILGFVSIFYSVSYSDSVRELIRLTSIFVLYFLAYRLVESKEDFYLLLKAILFSYIIPALVALIQLIGGWGLPDDFGGFLRIYGTFAHPNLFAFYTFFVLALTLSLLLAKKEEVRSWISKNPYFLPVIGITLLLVFTYTRSALACFFIFILFFGIFKYRKLLIFGSVFLILLYFSSEIFRERLLELFSLDPYGSIVWRFRLWKDMLPMFLWQPLFGHGLGTFTYLVEFYRGFQFGSLDPHNDYLKILVENGIAGLISFLSIVTGLLFYLWKIFKKSLNKEKILGLGFLVIVLSLLIAGSFDNILRTTALQWNLWILLGGWLKINKFGN